MTTDYTLDGLTPQKIYTPRDAQALAQQLAECNATKCTVVPWGGGTVQHLGSPPTKYDAVLRTTNLNQIIEYQPDDLTATFGAGMTLSEIDRALGENGQFLPLDVPHPERATIGGVLASGINGTLRLRYGPARDYMLGSRFATVDGEIIHAGSKVVKNVAGYELHKIQVGALGTLGVLTEATFKLFPKVPAEMFVWASFEDLSDACAMVTSAWNLSTPPLALELLNANPARLVEPNAQGAWHVAVRFGGQKVTMAAARDLCTQAAAENHARATNAVSDGAKLWRSIADLPATLREQAPDALLVRASVPPQALHAAIKILANGSLAPRIFAHAALTSIYASFEGDAALFEALVPQLRRQLHEIHGHLVVEHAPAAAPNLARWEDVGASLKMMRALKKKFDPNGILNPGRFVAGI